MSYFANYLGGYSGGYFGSIGSVIVVNPPSPSPGDDDDTGLFEFDPTNREFMDEAFERCGLDPAKLTVRHLRSGRRSLSLLFTEWESKATRLWALDEQLQALTIGEPDYDTADGTIAILDMVLRRNGVDTPVMPISRSEFATISNKADRGMPTRFYFQRTEDPSFTLWQVPENSTDVLHYWRIRRQHDVASPSDDLDVVSRWFEPLVSGLAAKLAVKFAPLRLAILKGEAKDAFDAAKMEERERVDLSISIGDRR